MTELGLKQNIPIKKFYYDKSPLAAKAAAEKMLKSDCKVILGLKNKNDLLLVKEILRDKILVISMYGEIEREEIPSNIVTMQPSSKYLTNKLFQYIDNQKIIIKHPLIVTSMDQTSFLDYKENFKRNFAKRNIHIFEIDILEKRFNEARFKKSVRALRGKYDSIVLLNLSLISAKMTDMLAKNKMLVLGTKNFGTSSGPGYYRAIKTKDVNVLFSRQNSLMGNSEAVKSFKKKYFLINQKNPYIISLMAYDAINYIFSDKENVNRNRLGLLKSAHLQRHIGVTGVIFGENLKVTNQKWAIMGIGQTGHSLKKVGTSK